MENVTSNTEREQEERSYLQKLLQYLSQLLKFLRRLLSRQAADLIKEQDKKIVDEPWENPYLDDFRNILEQILEVRQMHFGEFHPILIDSDDRDQSFMTEEDTVRLLGQIGEGLNSLEILTDRPEYFRNFSVRMNEDYGLLTQIFPRDYRGRLLGNVVLDLERYSSLDLKRWEKKMLYIPFYKRRWEIKQAAVDESGNLPEAQDDILCRGNLDIEVPIGYNIVTVKTKVRDLQNRL